MSATPWADACKKYPALAVLVARRNQLAALDRDLTDAETDELSRINNKITDWQDRLGLL